MTKILRRAGLLALSMLVMMVSMVGVATAQEGDEECYPVPPGGCEEAPPEDQVITCDDIIAAIESGEYDPALDTNDDGVIDEADLPANCTCEDILDAIADGTIDVENLPDTALVDCDCEELVAAAEAGDISADVIPDDCVVTQVADEEEGDAAAEETEVEAEGLADTGMDAGPMALTALAGLLAGLALVRVSRRA